jgi:hypothetical protein
LFCGFYDKPHSIVDLRNRFFLAILGVENRYNAFSLDFPKREAFWVKFDIVVELIQIVKIFSLSQVVVIEIIDFEDINKFFWMIFIRGSHDKLYSLLLFLAGVVVCLNDVGGNYHPFVNVNYSRLNLYVFSHGSNTYNKMVK